MRLKSALALVGSLFALAGAVQAAGESVTVDRARLSDPAYVASLHQEIEDAAVRECKAALSGSAFYQYQLPGCVAEAVEAAVSDVNAAELSAYAEQRYAQN